MTNPTKIVQLSVLTFAVAISQAFRTVPAITVNGIAEEMDAGPAALALFGGIFHWSFALMQIPGGLSLDIFGVRQTMVAFSGAAILGGGICCVVPNIKWLLVGETLLGMCCAQALLAAIVFTSKHWPAARFAGISGLVLAISNSGMILSATPLAWFVDRWSWRSGFVVLTIMSLVTLLASAMVLEKTVVNHSRSLAKE